MSRERSGTCYATSPLTTDKLACQIAYSYSTPVEACDAARGSCTPDPRRVWGHRSPGRNTAAWILSMCKQGHVDKHLRQFKYNNMLLSWLLSYKKAIKISSSPMLEQNFWETTQTLGGKPGVLGVVLQIMTVFHHRTKCICARRCISTVPYCLPSW